jgi:UDP-N-acetylglucosamine 2-epimerase (non-hydrolysing)
MPDLVIAQGDTTSVMAVALACFYRQIPFAHVEAGLRSFDLQNPYPEEFNRIVASRIAALHFAPTEQACANLRREGVPDAPCRPHRQHGDRRLALGRGARSQIPARRRAGPPAAAGDGASAREFRRTAARHLPRAGNLLDEHPDVEVLWPVHPNPNVSSFVRARLGAVPRVHLVEPLRYGAFVGALKQAYLVLTDSGGVQEEAPALARPVLVLRRGTERPEAIAAGVARRVGTAFEDIVAHARELLDDRSAYAAMARAVSPYGDGQASGRIVQAIRDRFVDSVR